MQIEIARIEDFIQSLSPLNNSGIYALLDFNTKIDNADVELRVSNHTRGFSVSALFNYIDDDVLILNSMHIADGGHFIRMPECQETEQFITILHQVVTGLEVASPCIFCGAHFLGFQPCQQIDPFHRTLAVLKAMELNVTHVSSLPVLEAIFPYRKRPVFSLIRPDMFVSLEIIRPPQICDGSLKQTSSGNQISYQTQKLKKSMTVQEVNGVYQEVCTNTDRDFTLLAKENNHELFTHCKVFLFHDKCYRQYKSKITPIVEILQINMTEEDQFIQGVVRKSIQMQNDNKPQTAKDASEFVPSSSVTATTIVSDVTRVNQYRQATIQQLPQNVDQYRAYCYLNMQQPSSLKFDLKQTFIRYKESFGIDKGLIKFEEELLNNREGEAFIKNIKEQYFKNNKK